MPDVPDTADVALAYLHRDTVSASFTQSLTNLLIWDFGHDQRLSTQLPFFCGSGGVAEGRNVTAKAFLDETDDNWLFWLDSDMGFAPNTLDALLSVATAGDLPIVGGLCFAWKQTELDQLGGFRHKPRPVIMDWTDLGDGLKRFAGRTTYQRNTLTRCDGTGSACIIIRRDVFETIRKEFGDTWYDRTPGTDGSLLGEDISFCMRAGACGFPIHVHTGVHTNHHKPVWISELDYLEHYPDNVT